MKVERFLIKCSKGYADGFDGEQYEWIQDKKTAWRMRREDAERRLQLIWETDPDAMIIPA